jgi:hypothetical protein
VLQQIGIGQLGMTEDEFWDTTPRAFFNAVEGHLAERQMTFEVMRLQALCGVNVWTKKPITDPQRLWKYPWENERKEIDIEQQKKRAQRVKEKMERIEKRGNVTEYE